MKKLLCFVLALLTVLPLVSCGGTSEPAGETDTAAPAPAPVDGIAVISGGVCPFAIVRPDIGEQYEIDAALTLRRLLQDTFGVEIPLENDYVKRGESYDPERKELLVGLTNRDESKTGYENLGKDDYRFYASENKIALCAGSERAMVQAVEAFFAQFADTASGTFVLPVACDVKGAFEYRSKAEYVGETFEVKLNDKNLGGGQFITKLYTEGLGRAPEGSEYAALANEFYELGIDPATLKAVVLTFFESDEMKAMNYTKTEAAFAAYRSVLNRDPTNAEIDAFNASDLAASAAALTDKAEFRTMIPRIIEGPYSYGKSNAKSSTGGPVFTASEVNKMLSENKVVALPENALVLCDECVNVGPGKVLTTTGQPENYLKMARFLRTKVYGEAVINLSDGATLSHVWVDGNRPSIGRGDGGNVYVGGSNIEVIGNKMSDTIAPSNMPVLCVMTGIYIAHNLITCYSSSHYDGWTDGITHQGRGIIEYNAVIDATDVPIIVFRDWTGAPQDTVVRFNKVINTGNSAYAALHTDAWYDEGDMNFNGCTFYENEVWTSWKTHFNLILSSASKAWFADGNDAEGAAFLNNYTPEGTFAVCGIAIVSDGMNNAVMRGNSLSVYTANIVGAPFKNHLIAANTAVYPADIQGPYDECAVHIPGGECYIGARVNEGAPSVRLREAIVSEDPVKLPKSAESAKHTPRKIVE